MLAGATTAATDHLDADAPTVPDGRHARTEEEHMKPRRQSWVSRRFRATQRSVERRFATGGIVRAPTWTMVGNVDPPETVKPVVLTRITWNVHVNHRPAVEALRRMI